MASNLARFCSVRGLKLTQRSFSTSLVARCTTNALTPEQRDRFYPKIGNRDIVGYGYNGNPNYRDVSDFPYPAIRFGENTPEYLALREKEKGDWKNLTIEEKKLLYRNSFCLTFAEMNAPTGEWKSILAAVLTGLAVSGFGMCFMSLYVYPPLPPSVNDEWTKASVQRMITQGQGRIEGISSNWDYEKGDWK